MKSFFAILLVGAVAVFSQQAASKATSRAAATPVAKTVAPVVKQAAVADTVSKVAAPVFGRCTVSTDPAEAMVYLGDSLKGKTPLVLDSLVPGKYEIQLKIKGYFIKKVPIDVAAGVTDTVFARLIKPARLVVVTEPGGALLKINSRDTVRTPYITEKLKPDTLRISIEKDGFLPVYDTLVAASGGRDSLYFSLTSLAPADTAKTPAKPHGTKRVMYHALISLGVFLVFAVAVLAVDISNN
jgi:hypothetical protein